MTPQELHILQHSLGLDQHGQGTWYRNHFCTDPECDNFSVCEELVRRGLMRIARGPSELTGGGHVFVVTDEGISAVKRESPAPPKLTRAQKRYRAWLAADSSMPFGEWIRRDR